LGDRQITLLAGENGHEMVLSVCVWPRVHLQNYLEQILSRMQGLLVLNSPNNGMKQLLSPEDQQFMYETAGVLIVQSQFTPEVRGSILSE